jgi:hypothetical protein
MGFGSFNHDLRDRVVAVGPAYAQNIIFIFCIECKVAVSLAPLTEFWGLRIRVDPAPLTGLVLWPQDRRIHLDPTPLTRFCGLRIEGPTWILHPSQGSVASGS